VSVSSQRSAGSEFHTDGPATEKTRSAYLVLVLWTTYSGCCSFIFKSFLH